MQNQDSESPAYVQLTRWSYFATLLRICTIFGCVPGYSYCVRRMIRPGVILNSFGGGAAVGRLSYLLRNEADEELAIIKTCNEVYFDAEMIDQVWRNASSFVDPRKHMLYNIEIEGELRDVVGNCYVVGGKIYRSKSVESMVEGWDMPKEEIHQITEWEWFKLQLEIKSLESLAKARALAQGPLEFVILPYVTDDDDIRCDIAGVGVEKLFQRSADKKTIREALSPMFAEGVRQIASVLESLPDLRAGIDLENDVILVALDAPGVCGQAYLAISGGKEEWLYEES